MKKWKYGNEEIEVWKWAALLSHRTFARSLLSALCCHGYSKNFFGGGGGGGGGGWLPSPRQLSQWRKIIRHLGVDSENELSEIFTTIMNCQHNYRA